jgi:predicted O-methyltransferase YrrM
LGDDAPKGALRPDDLAVLLDVAGERREVVELGTSKAWTAISLALACEGRRVTTYDPVAQHVRERYLRLAPSVRDRVRFVEQMGETGPVGDLGPVELLFIDSSHERDAMLREYEAWHAELAENAVVVFDDYDHPDFPGVTDAVQALALSGQTAGFLFIHRPDARG